MQVQVYDPMVFLETAFTLQSSISKAHSSASEKKCIWYIDQSQWMIIAKFFFLEIIEQGMSSYIHKEKE